jgi:Zn finger protein HypA/HybF involved in hydrogenase expression
MLKHILPGRKFSKVRQLFLNIKKYPKIAKKHLNFCFLKVCSGTYGSYG